jgi:hypothetical protein
MKQEVKWTTKDGIVMSVDDMTEQHAKNALKMMIRKFEEVKQIIKKEIIDGYLTDDEKAYVKRKVPALGKNNFKIKYGGYEGIEYAGNTEVQQQLLTALRDDTEFNIFVSSMILAQLAERYRDMNGVPKLHQVIAHYNGGRKYGERSKAYPNAWDAVKATDLPTETKNYMKKLVGTNGFLDVLTR